MKKTILLVLVAFTSVSCLKEVDKEKMDDEKNYIGKTIDQWHRAAAEAKFDEYMGYMTNDGVYIGTDATENWQKEAFKAFAKPYFDKGTAWNFTPLERTIYIGENGKIAWFDELLDTQMKICRGSGVLIKDDGKWKIAHYVLSMTMPNDKINEAINLKKDTDDALIQKIKSKK